MAGESGDDGGCFLGPAQITRNQRIEGIIFQTSSDGPALFATSLGQRAVASTLKTVLNIPFGLTMANHDEGGGFIGCHGPDSLIK
jgi:hypothetical protein